MAVLDPRLRLPARRAQWGMRATVFAASFGTMALEIAAGRALAPRLGVSLYTWTATLGVVLGGIGAGNYLGGRLADRVVRHDGGARALGLVLLGGAVASWLSLGVVAAYLYGGFVAAAPLVARVLLLNVLMLFPPCLCLAMVTPIAARRGVDVLAHAGSAVGTLYAWSTLGAIAGTLATGFVLVEAIGTRRLVAALALGLFALAVAAGWPWRRRVDRALTAGLALVLVGATVLLRSSLLAAPCLRETSYFCVDVREVGSDGPGEPAFALVLDHLFHSRVTPGDPRKLGFGYIRGYADMAAVASLTKPGLRVLMIGGGGYTLPRYLAATYPTSELHVLELDPAVTEANHVYLDLPRDTPIRTHVGDARALLVAWHERPGFDLVYGDAFNDLSVPYHLTTLEFDRMVDGLLTEDGVYLVNVIDSYGRGELLRAFLNTFAEVFPHVYLMRVGEPQPDKLETLVVAGAKRPIDERPFRDPGAYHNRLGRLVSTTLVDPAEVASYRSAGRRIVLTDDYAPVDQLTAPLFVLGER